MSYLKNKNKSYPAANYNGGEKREERKLEQSHIVLGFQGVDNHHKDRHAAMLMATIFGGGMSSRLFQEVREKHGLAYSVYASHCTYQDDGQFEIYAGTGPDKLNQLIPVVCDEIQKLVQDGVSAEELARAKSQLRSGILMGRESMLSRANRQAKYMINFNKEFDLQGLLGRIESVQLDDIQSVSRKIFSSKPTLAALGPLKDLEDYAQIKTRLAA